MTTAAERRGLDLSSAPEDVQAVLNRLMFLEDEVDRYREQADSLAHALTMARGFLGVAIKSPVSAAYVADCALEAYEDVRSGGASAPAPPAADREDTM